MNFTKLAVIFSFLFITGCTSQKKMIYLNEGGAPTGKMPQFTLRINPHDILSIQVFTVNTEAFPGVASTVDKQVIDNRTAYEKGFIVDEAGFVELPMIGKVMVGGLSIDEAKMALVKAFEVYMDAPVIMVKKLSFKVTILGEVAKPGLYYIPNEQLTMLEAIGMAGDLTVFGNRKEVKVVRRDSSGYREIMLDLTRRDALSGEVAFVYPDDVIYVSPIKRRGVSTVSPTVAVVTSIVATLTLIVSVILRETEF